MQDRPEPHVPDDALYERQDVRFVVDDEEDWDPTHPQGRGRWCTRIRCRSYRPCTDRRYRGLSDIAKAHTPVGVRLTLHKFATFLWQVNHNVGRPCQGQLYDTSAESSGTAGHGGSASGICGACGRGTRAGATSPG